MLSSGGLSAAEWRLGQCPVILILKSAVRQIEYLGELGRNLFFVLQLTTIEIADYECCLYGKRLQHSAIVG